MSKRCLFCGANLEDDDLFCDECGKKQEVSENVASVQKLVRTEEVSSDNKGNADISAMSSLEMKQYQEAAEEQRLQLISMRATSYSKMKELSEWYKMMRSLFDSTSICLHCGKKHLFEVKICKECGTVCENGIASNGKRYRQCWLTDKRTSYYLLQDNYFSYNVADVDDGLTIRRFRVNQNDHQKVDFIEFSYKGGRRVSEELVLQSIDIQNNEFDGFYCVIPKDNLGLTRTLSPDGKAAFWNMVDSKPIGSIQTVFPGGIFKLEGGNDPVIKKN